MEYVNNRGEVVPLGGLGPQWQQPTPEQKRAEVDAACPSWGVVWDGYRLQLVAVHPDYNTTGIRIHAQTTAELIARVRAFEAKH